VGSFVARFWKNESGLRSSGARPTTFAGCDNAEQIPGVKHEELKCSIGRVLGYQLGLAPVKGGAPERFQQPCALEVLSDLIRPVIATSHEVDHDRRVS
jgi:hypothetical protein